MMDLTNAGLRENAKFLIQAFNTDGTAAGSELSPGVASRLVDLIEAYSITLRDAARAEGKT